MNNTFKLLIVCCALGFAGIALALKPESTPQKMKTVKDGSSFAVVELFTSEGCSSCPPADQLLGQMVKKARANNKNVYALAFHVDYWDNLGWKDKFSSTGYSNRQRKYAAAFRSNTVYTPQMIVNGQDQFVGSNRAKAANSVQHALSKAATVTVSLNNVKILSGNQVQVDYKLNSTPENAVIHFAVVERDIVRHIKRGENSGLTMHHDNVVRAFKTISANQKSSQQKLDLPDDINLNKASVIAYVQNSNSMQILGANGQDIQAANS